MDKNLVQKQQLFVYRAFCFDMTGSKSITFDTFCYSISSNQVNVGQVACSVIEIQVAST